MPRKKIRRTRAAIMSRKLRVSSMAFSVWNRADKPRGEDPRLEFRSWFEIIGACDKPMREAESMTLAVHPESEWSNGTNGPPSIGSIIQFRPLVQAVIGIPTADFDRAWMMATSGYLKYCHVAFTELQRRFSFIVSASFSSQSEVEAEQQPVSSGASSIADPHG